LGQIGPGLFPFGTAGRRRVTGLHSLIRPARVAVDKVSI